jgi:non-ribosomal peptide synthetase component E (peptide arylation enzyme)
MDFISSSSHWPVCRARKNCFRRRSLPPKKFFGMLNSMNLATAFAASVEKRPGKTAIFWGETEIPYAALLAQSQKVAAHLQTKFGVKPGDRVNTWPSTGFSAGFPIGRGGRLGIWDRNLP